MQIEAENEQVAQIIRLLELLDRMNRSIDLHKQEAEPDLIAIEQYEHLRNTFIQELDLLLREFGLKVIKPDQAA